MKAGKAASSAARHQSQTLRFGSSSPAPSALTERVTGGGTKVVRVALVDAAVGFDVTPDVVAVDPGTHLILDVRNDGDGVHDLTVDGGSSRTRMLDPGESQRLDLGRVTGDIRALCTLPGHDFAGMSLDVRPSSSQTTDPEAGR